MVGSRDPATIESWFKNDTRANLGVVAGAPSQLLVLDVDVKHVDGHATLRSWRLEHADAGNVLPAHPSVTSPSGGRHHWFRLPAHVEHIPRNDQFLPGVEVKTCGGLVAVPPSVRTRTFTQVDDADGSLIEWTEPSAYVWDTTGVEIPEAPDWLLTDATQRRDGAVWSRNGNGSVNGNLDDDTLPPTSELVTRGFWREGQRNRDCFRLACRLWTTLGRERDVITVIRRAWLATETRATFSWDEAQYTTMMARGRMMRARAEECERVASYAETARRLRAASVERGAASSAIPRNGGTT
jgi:hypothetical protein